MANITLSNYKPAEVLANNALTLPIQTVQPIAISGSNGSFVYSTLSMGNLNGLSHYTSNGSIVGSYTVPTTGGISVVGNTTGQSSGSTHSLSGLNISAVGIVSAGWSSNTFIVSSPATTDLAQLPSSIVVAGNTTGQSSSGTHLLNSLNISAVGIVSAGWSSNTLIISAPGTTNFANMSISAGSTSASLGSMVFSNSNNVSFGLSGSTITASVAGGGGGVNFGVSTGGNTAGATGTVSTGNVVLVGNGVISLSQATGGAGSNATVSINAPALSSLSATGLISISRNGSTISIGANALTAFAVSNTTQGTSGTVNGTALSFAGAGNVSVGVSNNSIIISGAGGGGGGIDVTLGGNTSGALALVSTGTLFIAGGNNITLSQNANSITISGANAGGAQTGISGLQVSNTTYTSGTVSLVNANGISFGSSGANGISASYTVPAVNTTVARYFVGNTIGTSSSTVADQTISINNSGGISGGWSNGSLLFSAPATSSLSATGLASISVNGSTISIGAAVPLLSRTDFGLNNINTSSALTQGSASFKYIQLAQPITFSRIDVPVFISLATAALGNTADLNFSSGLVIYSRNGSTLSPVLGSLGNTTFTWDSNNNNYSSITGGKNISFGINGSLSPGEYWIGFQMSTTNNSSIGTATTLLGNSISLLLGTSFSSYQIGDFGNTYSQSQNIIMQGMFSNTITASNQTIALSNISATGAAAQNVLFGIVLRNY